MAQLDHSRRPLHHLRALIVEDDAADAELIILELRRSGFDVSWKRAQTEQEYLAGLADSPEIVLADYSLPQFSGNRALELLQQQGLGHPLCGGLRHGRRGSSGCHH